MKVFPNCVPCHFEQLKRVITFMELPDEKAFELYKKACEAFSSVETDIAPVEMADVIYGLIEKELNVADVFKEPKRKANLLAMKIVRRIEEDPDRDSWPLEIYAKLSALGNHIDMGAHDVDLDRFEKEIIGNAFNLTFEKDDFSTFESRLDSAKVLLYILDNAGEIVFDKLFIGKISERYPALKIYAAVRGRPIINDVTMAEAKFIKLDEVCEVINSESIYPGTILEKAGEAFQRIFREADLIVAKGQGNFEGLSNEAGEKLYFCLMAKCDTISKYIGVKRGTSLFSNRLL
ncbi:MAG TPA: ARMT1-like domain-containing protein [Thermotogota bacterium]|nr:ARMT1-like domain-containing protein [Thermotogota bacterium]